MTERSTTPRQRETAEQARMREMVLSIQKYIGTYHEQYGYLDYKDKTFIDDVLYGLGRALDKKYEFANGFDDFKAFLRTHLAVPSETASIVYLVECGFDYEGSDVKAIVTTLEEAEALQEKYRNTEHFSYDSVTITRWTVGEITEKRWEQT